MNISYIVTKSCHEDPDKIAVIFGDRQLTYRELESLIRRFAYGITSLGDW